MNHVTLFIKESLFLQESTLIEVVARSVSDCRDTASHFIYGRKFDKNVFISNAFSPNRDGINDLFRPELPMDRGYEVLNFSVYN